MASSPALSGGVLGSPVRGVASGRRFAVGAVVFALVWFAYVWVAMLPPEGQQYPLFPDGPTDLLRNGLIVPLFLLPGYLVLVGYYTRVLDAALDGTAELPGFGEPISLARQTALATVTGGAFLLLGVAVVLGTVRAASFLTRRPPSSMPEPFGWTVVVLVGSLAAHLAATQLVALLAAERPLRAFADVGRTLSLAASPPLLAGTLRAVVLLVAGGAFGYSLYVLVLALGSTVGPPYGVWGLVVPAAGAVALGAGVHYVTLCAVRVFGLTVRERVDENGS